MICTDAMYRIYVWLAIEFAPGGVPLPRPPVRTPRDTTRVCNLRRQVSWPQDVISIADAIFRATPTITY